MTENTHPLAKYRKAHGLTQEALAKDLKVTPVTIWRWENDKRTPRKKDAHRLAEMTGIPAHEFLRLEVA